jgi:hypothetical protein
MSSIRMVVTALLAASVAAACAEQTTAPSETTQALSARAAARGTCVLANGREVATGFDQYGYNRCAHNFVGTYGGWCLQQGEPADCVGDATARLNMKWNEEWDRGNATNWAEGPYDAWLDNEAKGDGWSEHFKTKWDATCASGSPTGSHGGECIWGPFEILMDHGMMNGAHTWWAKVTPAGYGN